MHFIHTLLTLLTASVTGAAIGYERQFRQRTAGLRTNTLVATSAAIFVHLAMTIDGSGGARCASFPTWSPASAFSVPEPS